MDVDLLSDLDRIELKAIRAYGNHGVSNAERAHPQPFEIDIVIYLAKRATADALSQTYDYSKATDATTKVIERRSLRLLETIAQELASEILAGEAVFAVEVAVRKLTPPVPQVITSAGVRILRYRQE